MTNSSIILNNNKDSNINTPICQLKCNFENFTDFQENDDEYVIVMDMFENDPKFGKQFLKNLFTDDGRREKSLQTHMQKTQADAKAYEWIRVPPNIKDLKLFNQNNFYKYQKFMMKSPRHPNPWAWRYKCGHPDCIGQSFSGRKSLDTHINIKHTKSKNKAFDLYHFMVIDSTKHKNTQYNNNNQREQPQLKKSKQKQVKFTDSQRIDDGNDDKDTEDDQNMQEIQDDDDGDSELHDNNHLLDNGDGQSADDSQPGDEEEINDSADKDGGDSDDSQHADEEEINAIRKKEEAKKKRCRDNNCTKLLKNTNSRSIHEIEKHKLVPPGWTKHKKVSI